MDQKRGGWKAGRGASGRECLPPWGQIKIHNCFLDVTVLYKQLP